MQNQQNIILGLQQTTPVSCDNVSNFIQLVDILNKWKARYIFVHLVNVRKEKYNRHKKTT